MKFKVGDKVRKNPATWQPSEFDAWGRGNGGGEVLEAFDNFDYVDVRWPAGRCFEYVDGLELVTEAGAA